MTRHEALLISIGLVIIILGILVQHFFAMDVPGWRGRREQRAVEQAPRFTLTPSQQADLDEHWRTAIRDARGVAPAVPSQRKAVE